MGENNSIELLGRRRKRKAVQLTHVFLPPPFRAYTHEEEGAPSKSTYHPLSQSSSSIAFGLVSIFLAAADAVGFALVAAPAALLVPRFPGVTVLAGKLIVVAVLAGMLGLSGLAARPLGNGFPPTFLADEAASHPAKSGSPSSSIPKGLAAETLAGGGRDFVIAGFFAPPARILEVVIVVDSFPLVLSSKSSSMSPQASIFSSSRPVVESKKSCGFAALEEREVRVDIDGEVTAWRWRADTEGFEGRGTGAGGFGGALLGRSSAEPLLFDDVMSPVAADILFVNEEIAQPVHEAASV